MDNAPSRPLPAAQPPPAVGGDAVFHLARRGMGTDGRRGSCGFRVYKNSQRPSFEPESILLIVWRYICQNVTCLPCARGRADTPASPSQTPNDASRYSAEVDKEHDGTFLPRRPCTVALIIKTTPTGVAQRFAPRGNFRAVFRTKRKRELSRPCELRRELPMYINYVEKSESALSANRESALIEL